MSDVHSENNPAPNPWTSSQGFEEQVATAVPLPSPETLTAYERALPGSTERIYTGPGETSSSLEIPEALMNALKTSAMESGISLEDALRRSITTTKLLRQEVREGNKILIRDRKGKYQEVVFLG
jgi:hypothetical protein